MRMPAIASISRAADGGVPGRLAQRRLSERAREVVRGEERREGHDDQEVEEEDPARHEPREVVEGAADEGRRAARLRQRGRPLRVRERHEQERGAGDEQDERRQAERHARDDPERDVERGGDLAVRDGEERRRVQHALEAAELACHQRVLCRSSVKRPTPRTMKSAPTTYPTTPPPAAAVRTRSATPSTANAAEKP